MSFRPGVVILCQFTKDNGIVCGSPALRQRRFCYFHQQWHNQRLRLAFGLSHEEVALARKRPNQAPGQDAPRTKGRVGGAGLTGRPQKGSSAKP